MHDQNFKNLILDYPREALAFFAPEEAAGDLDQARIVPIRQEQLKDRLGDRFRELDVPLLVEWPNGSREAILFIIEEETQGNLFSIHRLAHYCLDLAELMQTERVVPVVIFLNPGTHQESLQLGGDRHVYLDFSYLACDLKKLCAEDYKESDNIIARINLPNMFYPKQDKLKVYHAAQLGLLEIESDLNKQRKYFDFIDFYANLNEQEVIEYREHYFNEEDKTMGLVQTLIQEGMQKGMQKGIQEGIQKGMQKGRLEGLLEGESKLLKKLLERRFGILPEWVLERLNGAGETDLEHWAEAVLTMSTLEAIFKDSMSPH